MSLNSLLSDYLQEMQELAEGKLLPAKKGRDHPNDRGVSLQLCRSLFSRLTLQGFCSFSCILCPTKNALFDQH